MQAEDFSHSGLFRRACRLHERKLRAAVDVAVRAATGEAEVLTAAEGLFESCIAAIPYAPAVAFLARRARQARRALDRRRRRDPARGDPRRRDRLDARRHAHDRGDPPARRPRLRDRGRRHRPRGRPAPARRRRDRRALLPGPLDRRPQPPCRRAAARRRRLRRDPRLLARPRRDRGRARRPRARAAAGGQLPHRAHRLRRPALRTSGTWRDAMAPRRRRVLQRLRHRPLPQLRVRRGAGRDRHGSGEDHALGPRRRHRALRPRAARDPPARAAQARGSLLGAHHAGEGRRAARRGVPAGA